MELKTKALYFLSMLTLPLFGCQKEPLPENDGYNNNPDTTINIQPNHPILPPTNEPNTDSIFENADTLRFSWFYDWTGPLDDYVKSFTDVGDRVIIVPDTTEQSIKGSCERLVCQWPSTYNRFMNFVTENPYMVKISGVIYVPIVGDNLLNENFGMDKNTANLFKQLGITVMAKNTVGKSIKPQETTNEVMPRNTAQNMVQSETGYTIEFGFDRHLGGPSEDHIRRRTAQYGTTHVIPDSTLWSKLQQGQFSKDDWNLLAAKFMKFQNEYGTTFEGNLYPRLGWMGPKAKTIFENLGFHVVEMIEKNDNRPAMPWNQAQQMLQNKSR